MSIAGEYCDRLKSARVAPVTGFEVDKGPHRRLIQLLPSSVVAEGLRLNWGVGSAFDSLVPGGTCHPRLW